MDKNEMVITENASLNLIQREMGMGVEVPDVMSNIKQMFRMIFTDPRGWNDGIFRSPLIFVAEYLRKRGYGRDAVQVGLLITVALSSVRLGYPLSLILVTDDYPQTADLLNACKRILPNDVICDGRDLKWEQLYRDQGFLKNKVIVCDDAKSLKKCMPDINDLIVFGKTTRQVQLGGKFGVITQTITAEYPTSLVCIENADNGPLISHPSIIRVPVSSDLFNESHTSDDNFDLTGNGNLIDSKVISKMFDRIPKTGVSVPFFNDILAWILKQRIENLRTRMEVIRKVIQVCATLANPPQFNNNEIIAKYIGIDMEQLMESCAHNGVGRQTLPGWTRTIQAGREDYYVAKALLDNIVSSGSEMFTITELRLFKTVRKINIMKCGESMEGKTSIIKKIIGFPRIPDRWAHMHDIMNELKKESAPFMPEPHITKCLGKLKKRGVIDSKKGDSNKGEGYYILVPEIHSYVELPKLPDLGHPDLQGAPTKIVNPITGEIEVI